MRMESSPARRLSRAVDFHSLGFPIPTVEAESSLRNGPRSCSFDGLFTDFSRTLLRVAPATAQSEEVNILCIEDDPRISAVLEQALTEEGHHVTRAANGRDGEAFLRDGRYDIAVLDLMLPELDGFEVLRHVRATRLQTPVLVLSARDSMPDVIRALDLGADDYLTKPFHLDMFLARVRSVGRRGAVAESPVLKSGKLRLDRARHQAWCGDEPLPLTRREFAILEVLLRRASRVVPREALLEAAWGLHTSVSPNSLEFHIHGLRSKLGAAGNDCPIRTVRGLGYQIEA